MCKVILGITKEPGNKQFSDYILAQYEELEDQKNGIGAAILTDKKWHVFRELTDYEKVFKKVYELIDKAKVVSIHTRTATSGSVNLDNVHFFEVNNYLFAHNGWAMKYHKEVKTGFFHQRVNSLPIISSDENLAENLLEDCEGCFTSKKGLCRKHEQLISNSHLPVIAREEGMCDSYQFLQNLKKPVTIKNLEEEIESKEFTGVGVLINKKTNDIFLLVKKDVKAQFNESFGVFYSYTPEKEHKTFETESVFGASVLKTEIIKTDLPIRTLVTGVYQIIY